MSEPARGFEPAEFAARTARAQRLMASARLDALLLSTEAEVRWFSGFHTRFWESPTRPWFLVVPADGGPIAVIPEIGAAGMATTWVEDIRTWPAPRPEDDGVSLLAATVLGLPRRHGRLGVPMGPESHVRMPLADLDRLRREIAALALVDAQPLVKSLREVKSDAEIAKIRHACRIAGDAFGALPGAIARGVSERSVARTFVQDVLARGADSVPYVALASGPGGYGDIIMGPSERTLADGDVMILDTGATFDGYFCDYDRNWAVGDPGEPARRAYRACWEATEAGLAAARPGATAEQVWAAMWRVLEAAGASGAGDVGRMGHGLGMQLTEGHSHRPGDATVLRPGMVLTLEPGYTFAPGRLMVHEEDLVVRDGAPELLTLRAPPELPQV